MSNTSKTDEKIREMKREYMRKWRSCNRDKVAAINKRYWEKKAEKALAEKAKKEEA